MSIDSSVSTDAPVMSAGVTPDPDPAVPDVNTSDGSTDDDSDNVGATTAGGPTMIWILTGIYVLVFWLRRRRRIRRESL
jgi:hypothetical protein